MIAGESSLAYDEIVTANLVTCRAIGIGAYLVRMGFLTSVHAGGKQMYRMGMRLGQTQYFIYDRFLKPPYFVTFNTGCSKGTLAFVQFCYCYRLISRN